MSDLDIPHLAHRIDVSEDHLRAFLEVEARSRGYDRAGRPVMLFEPHVFYRQLSGQERDEAVRKGLAYARWGAKPYPRESYTRLEEAVKINERAALMAASIGLSQVLVENYALVGYETPQAMWNDFMDDEEAHVEAMVNYILATNIADDLKREDWRSVARTYNGPGYAKNNYHTKMAAAFAKFRGREDLAWERRYDHEADEWQTVGDVEETEHVSDPETVRSVQKRLKVLGYPEVGEADGLWGSKTRAGVLAYRADNQLPLWPWIDEALLADLMMGPKRSVSEKRASTSAEELRADGSRTIKSADGSEKAGILAVIGGAAVALSDGLDALTGGVPINEGIPAALAALKPVFDAAESYSMPVVIAIGLYIVWQQRQIKAARVSDHREAINVGR